MSAGDLRKLFDAYWDAEPTQREALLESVEADDPDLADRLRRLIRAEAKTAASDVTLPEALKAGRHIGAFRIQELLGSGGMGQVFLAIQEQPVRREVALKVMPWHASLDREQRARFTATAGAGKSVSPQCGQLLCRR